MVKEIVEIILREAGQRDLQVQFDATKPTTIPIRAVDTSKAAELLGFRPTLTLEEGLADTVKWYKTVKGD